MFPLVCEPFSGNATSHGQSLLILAGHSEIMFGHLEDAYLQCKCAPVEIRQYAVWYAAASNSH